ncbi:MAG TPA: adenosylhomocysteinase [Chloroflexota bacterium]|nr:adenosylhomocysteinase [Chloroflexota bacterium]
MATHTLPKHDVKDLGLAARGRQRIEWAATQMPVLALVRERFQQERPLAGVRVGACLHVTTETANLMLALQAGGAEIDLCASNPLSTQDDVAAALVAEYGLSTFAIKGEGNDVYYQHINAVLADRPEMTMDDGCDLVTALHKDRTGLIDNIIGGCEETTTGVIRLKSMEAQGVLRYPIIAVNEASTKHFFDNRYGTGQSTLDGIVRATNFLIAGCTFVVGGYGWCGRGIAMRARGLGANVVVTEVDPIRALEALMDGYRVMPSVEAAKIANIFVTATGDLNVIDQPQLEAMRDGAILANSGHFNDEINIPALTALSAEHRPVRDFVEEFRLHDGRRLYLLADGRLVNLSAAEGHPAGVMDMSFANQALSAAYLRATHKELENKVYVVPADIDREVARLKLRAMGVVIDTLTPEQEKYLNSWESGT